MPRTSLTLLPLLALLAACPADDADSGKEDTATPPTEDCEVLELDEGGSGTYTADPEGEDHVKHHWTMPDGVDHLVVTASWDGSTGWLLEMSVGKGYCPHSGTTLAEGSSDSGELVVELHPEDEAEGLETFTAGEQWFLHLGLADYAGIESGDTLDYEVEVQACHALAAD